MRILILAFLSTMLIACGRGQNVKADLPGACGVHPQPVLVERRVYVAIPADLTSTEPLAEGPIAQCFSVAAERRKSLERANSKLRKIGQIQGTEVEP